jgi:membrane protease YdiL (CAAX protease family)
MKEINITLQKFVDKMLVVMMCYGVNMLYLFVFAIFLNYLQGYTLPEIRDLYQQGFQWLFEPPSPQWIFFMGVISAPLWEEYAFRVFPQKVAGWAESAVPGTKMLIPLMVFTSIIFGYGHGGPIHIWIQGVAGLIFSYCYIKTNCSYWSSVCLHFLTNFTLMYLLPLFMKG